MAIKMRSRAAAVSLTALLSIPFAVSAQEPAPAPSDPLCEDSGLLGPKLFTDICWSCLFPIKVAGAQFTPGNAPSQAATQSLCLCPKGTSNIMSPGVVTSMWEPARLIEHVKKPGCSPALSGRSCSCEGGP